MYLPLSPGISLYLVGSLSRAPLHARTRVSRRARHAGHALTCRTPADCQVSHVSGTKSILAEKVMRYECSPTRRESPSFKQLSEPLNPPPAFLCDHRRHVITRYPLLRSRNSLHSQNLSRSPPVLFLRPRNSLPLPKPFPAGASCSHATAYRAFHPRALACTPCGPATARLTPLPSTPHPPSNPHQNASPAQRGPRRG